MLNGSTGRARSTAPPLLTQQSTFPSSATYCWTYPQEVEKQYKEGTLKYHLVRVLKAVQPEALTAAGEGARKLEGRCNGVHI